MKLINSLSQSSLFDLRTFPVGSSNIPCWFVVFLATLLLVSSAAADFGPRPAAQKIDQLIDANLEEQKLKAYPRVSDEQLVRRTYLAIIGRIPTIAEADDFLQSNEADKHSALIHQLLASDAGYTAHHYQFWADLLRIPTGLAYTLFYQMWIKEQIAANTPYDELVRKLVSGHGLLFDDPAETTPSGE